MKTSNPFRKRSPFDKICVWLLVSGKPLRFYCTSYFRTKDGALGLERIMGKSRIATAAKSAITEQILTIEQL